MNTPTMWPCATVGCSGYTSTITAQFCEACEAGEGPVKGPADTQPGGPQEVPMAHALHACVRHFRRGLGDRVEEIRELAPRGLRGHLALRIGGPILAHLFASSEGSTAHALEDLGRRFESLEKRARELEAKAHDPCFVKRWAGGELRTFLDPKLGEPYGPEEAEAEIHQEPAPPDPPPAPMDVSTWAKRRRLLDRADLPPIPKGHQAVISGVRGCLTCSNLLRESGGDLTCTHEKTADCLENRLRHYSPIKGD